MRWFRNEIVEQKLKELGIPFHWEENIPFKKLNIKKSLKNNARIMGASLDDDVVLNLAIVAERDDAALPGLVLTKAGNSYDINDGNHRSACCEVAGLVTPKFTVSAYVLDTDDEALIELATRVLNRTNGLQQNTEEAVEQCVRLLDKYPAMSAAELGKIFGVKDNLISRHLRARHVADKLTDHKIRATGFPVSTLVSLGQLDRSEPAMIEAATIAQRHKLPGTRVQEMVNKVKKKRSEASQLIVLADIDKELSRFASNGSAGTRRILKNKENFQRAIVRIMDIVHRCPSREHLELTARSDYEEAKYQWEKARKLVDKVFAK